MAGAAGDAVGAVGAARFRSPRALACSGSVLFVADSGNGKIKAVSLLGAGAGVRLVGPAGDGAPAGIQVFPGSAGASLLVAMKSPTSSLAGGSALVSYSSLTWTVRCC